MNAPSDRDLRKDLETLYLSDPPGGEFTERVLSRTEGQAGGEHEIGVQAGRGLRVWPFVAGVAAALVLLLLVVRSPTLHSSQEAVSHLYKALVGSVSAPGATPAAPADPLSFPSAAIEAPAKSGNRVIILVHADGTLHYRGKTYDSAGLAKKLEEELRALRTAKGAKADLFVLVRADKDVKWRQVQKVMQALASPGIRIYKIQFAVSKPTPPKPAPGAEASIVLSRTDSDSATRIRVLGDDLGSGKAAWKILAARVKKWEPGSHVMLEAAPAVPHEDVIRVIDILLSSGISDIGFVGAPPREARPGGKRETKTEGGVVVHLGAGASGIEVRIEGVPGVFGLDKGIGVLKQHLADQKDTKVPRHATVLTTVAVSNEDLARILDVFRAAGFDLGRMDFTSTVRSAQPGQPR